MLHVKMVIMEVVVMVVMEEVVDVMNDELEVEVKVVIERLIWVEVEVVEHSHV